MWPNSDGRFPSLESDVIVAEPFAQAMSAGRSTQNIRTESAPDALEMKQSYEIPIQVIMNQAW